LIQKYLHVFFNDCIWHDFEVIYQHFENFGEAQAENVEPRVMSFILRLRRTSRKRILKTS
jgi:hypothetical protein